MQIQDLNRGSFGFVCLCKNRLTNEIVAVKFIERGDKVGCQRRTTSTWTSFQGLAHNPSVLCLQLAALAVTGWLGSGTFCVYALDPSELQLAVRLRAVGDGWVV